MVTDITRQAFGTVGAVQCCCRCKSKQGACFLCQQAASLLACTAHVAIHLLITEMGNRKPLWFTMIYFTLGLRAHSAIPVVTNTGSTLLSPSLLLTGHFWVKLIKHPCPTVPTYSTHMRKHKLQTKHFSRTKRVSLTFILSSVANL